MFGVSEGEFKKLSSRLAYLEIRHQDLVQNVRDLEFQVARIGALDRDLIRSELEIKELKEINKMLQDYFGIKIVSTEPCRRFVTDPDWK